jgi:EAL domain-containing protein (putative c-di-GMP-specific phosphodiesterase class I)
MTVQQPKPYNLPWHLNDHYWICIYPKATAFSTDVVAALTLLGLQTQKDGALAIKTGREWKKIWDGIYASLQKTHAVGAVDAAIAVSESYPETRALPDNKAILNPQIMAENLWIGDALLADRIMCYLQPVMTAKNHVFGYESFARVKHTDGSIIEGAKIVDACKIMNIEHMVDRHLQVQAIKTFANSEFNGFLFVNFFPGFIHRPAVYLEGLGETAKQFGIIAKHIVLDFTKSETPHDMEHVKNVSAYGRSCGYSVALDDISSVDIARKLIKEVRPDFVKIDMHLVRQVEQPDKKEVVRILVDLVHSHGGTVIAEGVETVDIYETLKTLGVDLFQGYLFSPPVPVEVALSRSAAV